ncbi:MAG: putative sulfate exporter family transporter [Chitinophagaceae bacterium]
MSEPEKVKRSISVSEDWTVVILGFLIIIAAIAGVRLAAPQYAWKSGSDLFLGVFSGHNILLLVVQLLVSWLIAVVGAWLTGKNTRGSFMAFPLVFILTVVSSIVAGNVLFVGIGLEPVIFSLLAGLLISNLFPLPDWFRNALSTEIFVKIGLVLLGATIVFSDILKAGVLGLIQSLLVVLSVWYFAFWICHRLKVDKELSLMISSGVSICGVSAAIATAGAIEGDNKKLSYVISIVLLCAVPMLVGMPYLARWLDLSPEVTGAWLGGTIDTTGAVVGAGTLIGDTALKYATIVKFSQNVLLGLAAFAISVYWTYTGKVKRGEKEKASLKVIWQRFPKFVIGFIAASLLFSFLLPDDVVTATKGTIKGGQTLWFSLAFTSIGLETRFADLFNKGNKKPMIAFLIAQAFNIIVTLVIAYLLFGHAG